MKKIYKEKCFFLIFLKIIIIIIINYINIQGAPQWRDDVARAMLQYDPYWLAWSRSVDVTRDGDKTTGV